MKQDSGPIPTRLVLLAFFAVVLLCAVFFSLGYFLGHEQRNPASPTTEQVSPSSDIPPAVNPPADSQSSGPSEEAEQPPAPVNASPATDANSPSGNSSQAAAPLETPRSSASVAANPLEKSEPASPPARRARDESSAIPSATAPSTLTQLPPGLTVQVAALSTQADAANMVQVLKSRGYPALLFAPESHSKDIFYRVIVGPYKTKKQVDQVRSKLAEEGFKPFVRQ